MQTEDRQDLASYIERMHETAVAWEAVRKAFGPCDTDAFRLGLDDEGIDEDDDGIEHLDRKAG